MQKHDLADFMASATNDIQNEYIRIQKRATEDPGTAGDQGEENWAALLRNWLPPTFQIVTKGRILSHKGIASPQVDIIVLQPEYPRHLLDKKLYLAGGVIAAFECKVTLKSEHLQDFFKNSIEIKNHTQERKGTPYKELQCSILYGLLAHSHCWKGENSTPIKNIEDKLWAGNFQYITHPKQLPDVLCIADLATWTTQKITFVGPNQLPWRDSEVEMYGKNGCAAAGFVCHSKDKKNQSECFTPIGKMLTGIMNSLAREYPSLRSLARYFELTDIQGSGKGNLRKWDSSIYSDEIRSRVVMGQLSNGKAWDEWSVSFW